jgi:hypothetical protein
MDLLQQLSEAALFQELCSGDMHAVPGLMTSSRLNCLMHLLTDEATSPSSSSLLNAKEGKPSAGGSVLKAGMVASTATASLDGVSCLEGSSTSKDDAAAAVESSQGDVSSAEGEAALASSSSNAHLDKPVLLQDREVEGSQQAWCGSNQKSSHLCWGRCDCPQVSYTCHTTVSSSPSISITSAMRL